LRFIIVQRTIPAADAVAFHVMDDESGEEVGRFLFEDRAKEVAWKLNHQRVHPGGPR
jgi:hypothetical protein